MKGQRVDAGRQIRCPRCNEDAFYKYGMTAGNKQRYRCLSCGRQFTLESMRVPLKNRPACPACGSSMHVYKTESHSLRYRCSCYPECATYVNIKLEDTQHDALLP